MNKTLISVIGPTAIGKTKLAIALANHFNTEIISADSRQFYKEMHIGTAVPDQDELKAAKHHFIQHISIFDPYSVGDFERDALRLIEHLFKTHDVVVMVGGSGLYIDAVTKGLDKFPSMDPNLRVNLNNELKEKGIGSLQMRLKTLDSTSYARIDLENPHRLIRALEVSIGSGRPYSSFLNQKKAQRSFNTLSVGIKADRELIYDRINKRVDAMIKDGLLEEAKQLFPHRTLNALQTVGYRELFHFLEGNCDLETAMSDIKKNTRRFAKRQLTWFRKNEQALWIDVGDPIPKVFQSIQQRVEKFAHGKN